MFKAVAHNLDRAVRSYMPDPLVIVMLITALVFVLGLFMTESTPIDMVEYWGEGFWDLLTLAMQFVFVLCTGFILATSPPFKRLLAFIARFSSTPTSAVISVTLVALAASWLNWAFGLVIGALYAREMVRHVPAVNYRLLIASAYSGFIVWHGGLGGSVPLLVNTPGHFAEDLMGLVPTSETIFSTYNLVIVAALFVLVPLVNCLSGRGLENDEDAGNPHNVENPPIKEPGNPHSMANPAVAPEDELKDQAMPKTPADRMESSYIIAIAIGLLGLAYVVYYFANQGFDLNINIVNFVFLTLAILCNGTPRRFLDSLQEAVKGAGGIVIQFPFYAGVMGMMAGSGLVQIIAGWFVAISNETTLPLFTFLSAGLVNLFIPSGGGQFAVQGPIMILAADQLGVDHARTAMALAWGDAWTNMIQPFWALPALAIAGLKAREIMGFCLMILLVSALVIIPGIMFLPA